MCNALGIWTFFIIYEDLRANTNLIFLSLFDLNSHKTKNRLILNVNHVTVFLKFDLKLNLLTTFLHMDN